MHTLTRRDLVLPRRKRESHKGQHGKVLVIGGSEAYAGAVALAGIAALRSGADLVTIAAPEKVAWAINALSPDLITRKMPGKTLTLRHYPSLKALAADADVLLIGNGIGRAPGTARLVRKLVALRRPLVIDADALRMVRAEELRDAIITPHAGELKAFLENSGIDATQDPARIRTLLAPFFARGNVLLMKGATDHVICARTIVRNMTGNPGMTKGGTGDVLAGLCAGYYAQLHDAWTAACDAAYVNGLLGDLLLEKRKGYTYLASDLVEELRRLTPRR